MCVCVCVCCGVLWRCLTFYLEVVERLTVCFWWWFVLVPIESAICLENKPAVPPVLYVLTCRREGRKGEREREREREEGGNGETRKREGGQAGWRAGRMEKGVGRK